MSALVVLQVWVCPYGLIKLGGICRESNAVRLESVF